MIKNKKIKTDRFFYRTFTYFQLFFSSEYIKKIPFISMSGQLS